MGAAIFLCRLLPFLLFRGNTAAATPQRKWVQAFLSFIEKTTPPVAMTCLAISAILSPVRDTPSVALPVVAASVVTAVLHIWRRNTMLSICAGTLLYMVLIRVL
jgi:branched-subunit amino acid transport protein AzlD